MAGDWIKMRSNLWDDPRIACLVEVTNSTEASVIGGLYWLWATADQHSEDGVMPGMTPRTIDRKSAVPGLGAALVTIGWIEDHPEGLHIMRFDEHNGTSAKKRAVTAKRVANHRGNADVTLDALPDEYDGVTGALAREREREEVNQSSTDVDEAIGDAESRTGEQIPNCPHQKLIDLYALHLPTLPFPAIWEGKRQNALRARWRWVLTAKKRDGSRHSTDEASAVAWFERFFAYVAKSDFLTGRNDKFSGCDLGWLMKADNFAKVIQGNYENKGSA